jgi:hypothetical protein
MGGQLLGIVAIAAGIPVGITIRIAAMGFILTLGIVHVLNGVVGNIIMFPALPVLQAWRQVRRRSAKNHRRESGTVNLLR